MEWVGFACLAIMLCYSAYPGKVRKLESKVKKLQLKQKGVSGMSKIISELVGKNCIIETDEALQFVGDTKVKCTVLDVDDEWMKFSYADKKGNVKTKIMRIDKIDGVELEEENFVIPPYLP